MRRSLVFTGAIVGLMTITPPAQAKFVVRVVIDGPGLVEPVELSNTAVRVGCTLSTYCHPVSHPPNRRLGPRYTVTQSLEGHHARGLMMDRIVHYLYPYAPEGPWVLTTAGQIWHDWNRIRRVPGGWTPADRSLMKALRANGLSPKPPVERVASPTARAEERQGIGLATVGGLVGVGVLLAGGAFLGRPRRRR